MRIPDIDDALVILIVVMMANESKIGDEIDEQQHKGQQCGDHCLFKKLIAGGNEQEEIKGGYYQRSEGIIGKTIDRIHDHQHEGYPFSGPPEQGGKEHGNTKTHKKPKQQWYK